LRVLSDLLGLSTLVKPTFLASAVQLSPLSALSDLAWLLGLITMRALPALLADPPDGLL